MSGECYVYLIVSDGPAPNGPLIRKARPGSRVCKVGISANPWSRAFDLQTASAYRLTVKRVWEFLTRAQAEWVERKVHKRIENCRLMGEWFFHNPLEIMDFITDVAATEAIWEFKWPAEDFAEFLRVNKYDPDYARDLIVAHYGEESVA